MREERTDLELTPTGEGRQRSQMSSKPLCLTHQRSDSTRLRAVTLPNWRGPVTQRKEEVLDNCKKNYDVGTGAGSAPSAVCTRSRQTGRGGFRRASLRSRQSYMRGSGLRERV